jgi:hypothetical protein
MNLLTGLPDLWVPLVMAGADKVPAPEDVKAGWGAFALFIALAMAVAFLGFSLSRHLRKAKENAELGAFDRGDDFRDDRSDDGEPHRNRPSSASP